VPLDEARVPITDRGFLWGDHVFEVIRAEAGRLCDGDAHLARLVRSAALVRMSAPDVEAVERAIAATLAACAARSAAVRVIWTRGEARTLSLATAGAPRLVIIAEPLALAAGARGIRLAVVRGGRGGLVPAAAKSGNHLGSVLALAAAADAGADDALLVDEQDRVLETASANLFLVEPGGVVTPSGALLAGVTGARVAQLLRATGHTVLTGAVSLDRVVAATELFVTSSRRGVMPVVALDGSPRDVGPVARAAATAYGRWLEACAEGRETAPLAYTGG